MSFKKRMHNDPNFRQKVLARRVLKKQKRIVNTLSKSLKAEQKELDNKIKKYYKNWMPIHELSRSFFIYRGKYSGSPKEIEIANIFKSMNLRYYSEVSFDMVKRFDFYIPLIDLVIEYDGSQHFKDLNQISNDINKEKILNRLGVKFIRYNKTHDLKKQIAYDLIHHPILNKK